MWIETQCHIKGIKRLFRSTERVEHRPFAVPGGGIVRLQLLCPVECGERVLAALQRTQRRTFPIPGNNQRRVQLQRAIKRVQRLGVALQQPLCQPASLPAKRVRVIELERLRALSGTIMPRRAAPGPTGNSATNPARPAPCADLPAWSIPGRQSPLPAAGPPRKV